MSVPHKADIEGLPTKVCFWWKAVLSLAALVNLPSCWSHSIGNCCRRSSSSRVAGCRPSRMASTMVGALTVSNESTVWHASRSRFMRSTKPKDFRSIPSACIDAHAASRRTLCGDPSNSASKSRTISRSKRAASGSVVSCAITR